MSNRKITIEPFSIGDLLQDVGRVYLHNGCPSSFMKRVCKSFEAFIKECEHPEDVDFARELLKDIESLQEDWSSREKSRYANK